MKNIIQLILIVLTFQFALLAQARTGTYYREIQQSTIGDINLKQQTIVFRGMYYPLHKNVRVYDPEDNFPKLEHLYKTQIVKFKTVKNRKTNRVEIKEIWIVPQ